MTSDPGRLHPDGAPGSAEAQARSVLGDANYEHIRDATKRQQEITFNDAVAHTEHVLANAALVKALGFLVSVATLLGVGWSIWWWVS